jgi:mono/diheme cytochrome c family protein
MLNWIAAAAALCVTSATAQGADHAKIEAGKRVAQRSCGGCHAVADGPSPLPEAPPFRTLHERYPAGGLDQLLSEAVMTQSHRLEEGRSPGHWRMGWITLDDDERAKLAVYLKSLEPIARKPST